MAGKGRKVENSVSFYASGCKETAMLGAFEFAEYIYVSDVCAIVSYLTLLIVLLYCEAKSV